MFFRNKKVNAFGLDVSDASIKVMQLGVNNRKADIQAHANLALPDHVFNNHMIINEQRLAESIKKTVAAAGKIDTDYVVCSIPEIKSFVRVLKIPIMDEWEIQGALPYELEQDIPIPIDQVYLDWQLIRKLPDGLEILAAAAPKDYVNALITSLHMAKLRPVAMELESFATARSIMGPAHANNHVLIVDFATAQTSFVVVENGVIIYTSSISTGGDALTESIVQTLHVDKKEAERLKREVGLASTEEGQRIGTAIFPILDSIADEAKNVIRFFEEHSAEHQKIDTILLCGSGANLFGIKDYIGTRLNAGVLNPINRILLANPWINIPGMPAEGPLSKGESLDYVTSVGLALRGFHYEID